MCTCSFGNRHTPIHTCTGKHAHTHTHFIKYHAPCVFILLNNWTLGIQKNSTSLHPPPPKNHTAILICTCCSGRLSLNTWMIVEFTGKIDYATTIYYLFYHFMLMATLWSLSGHDWCLVFFVVNTREDCNVIPAPGKVLHAERGTCGVMNAIPDSSVDTRTEIQQYPE